MSETWRAPVTWAAIIVGLCFLLSSLVAAVTFYKVKNLDNTLQVTGSARQPVTSDTVKWLTVFNRQVDETNLKQGYQQMKDDLAVVNKFFNEHKISQDQLIISPIAMDQMTKYGAGGVDLGRQYNLRQTIELQSADVQGITKLVDETKSIIDQGVIFSTQSLEYYYSKLPQLRVELLGEAVKDARQRAGNIAESGGRTVGGLKSASVGVVQVLPVNSIEVSDYGSYDTSKIDKEVMVTVRAVFTVK